MYQSLIKKALVLGVIILIVNALAHSFYWYTAIFGFDKFMHTLGGIFIVLIVASVYVKELRGIKSWQLFVSLTLSAFVVGLIWEYYEYIVQAFIKAVHLADVPDSIGDLIFDCIGGALGALFVISTKKSYNKKNER